MTEDKKDTQTGTGSEGTGDQSSKSPESSGSGTGDSKRPARPRRPRGRRGGRGRGGRANSNRETEKKDASKEARSNSNGSGTSTEGPKEAGPGGGKKRVYRGPRRPRKTEGEKEQQSFEGKRTRSPKAPQGQKTSSASASKKKPANERYQKGAANRKPMGRGRPQTNRPLRNRAPRPHLSVVIPAYNESKLISDTIKTVSEYLRDKRYPYELIIVDDGSTDSTVEIAKGLTKKYRSLRVIENGVNKGKGFSVRSGMLAARANFICFSDADLSTPIEEVDGLLKWLEDGFDIAIGSRSLLESRVEVHQPRWRELMGKGFNLIVQILAVRGIKDTQCGFKCFTSKAAREIFSLQTLDGFSFDVEALFIAGKLGFKVKETPVRWINRFESRVNPILHPIQMLFEVIKIRLWDLGGKYRKKSPPPEAPKS